MTSNKAHVWHPEHQQNTGKHPDKGLFSFMIAICPSLLLCVAFNLKNSHFHYEKSETLWGPTIRYIFICNPADMHAHSLSAQPSPWACLIDLQSWLLKLCMWADSRHSLLLHLISHPYDWPKPFLKPSTIAPQLSPSFRVPSVKFDSSEICEQTTDCNFHVVPSTVHQCRNYSCESDYSQK